MVLELIIFANSQTTSCLQNEEEWIVVLTTKTCRRSFLFTDGQQNVKRSKLFIAQIMTGCDVKFLPVIIASLTSACCCDLKFDRLSIAINYS